MRKQDEMSNVVETSRRLYPKILEAIDALGGTATLSEVEEYLLQKEGAFLAMKKEKEFRSIVHFGLIKGCGLKDLVYDDGKYSRKGHIPTARLSAPSVPVAAFQSRVRSTKRSSAASAPPDGMCMPENAALQVPGIDRPLRTDDANRPPFADATNRLSRANRPPSCADALNRSCDVPKQQQMCRPRIASVRTISSVRKPPSVAPPPTPPPVKPKSTKGPSFWWRWMGRKTKSTPPPLVPTDKPVEASRTTVNLEQLNVPTLRPALQLPSPVRLPSVKAKSQATVVKKEKVVNFAPSRSAPSNASKSKPSKLPAKSQPAPKAATATKKEAKNKMQSRKPTKYVDSKSPTKPSPTARR